MRSKATLATVLLISSCCCYVCAISLVSSTIFAASAQLEATDAAMDNSGNVVYITSAVNGVFRLGTSTPFQFPLSTINPNGITCDSATNVFYIASIYRVWSVTTSNSFVSLAGGNSAGYADGTGDSALFNYPTGIVSLRSVLYVADTRNSCLRKVDLTTNSVITIAQQPTPNYLCINKQGTILYVTRNSGSTGVVRIFITNGTSLDVQGSGTHSRLQGVALNSDETALIVAEINYLKQINLSTTVVTRIAATRLITPSGLKWYCLSSGVCGVLVADTIKVSLLRLRPGSTSASLTPASSNSQTASISNSEVEWSVTTSMGLGSASMPPSASPVSVSKSVSASISASQGLPTLSYSISSARSLTNTQSTAKSWSAPTLSGSFANSMTFRTVSSSSSGSPSRNFTATFSNLTSKSSTLDETHRSQSPSLSNSFSTHSATKSVVSSSNTSPNCSTHLSMSPLSVNQALQLCPLVGSPFFADEAVCTPIVPLSPYYGQRNSSSLTWQYTVPDVDAAARSSSQFLLLAFALNTNNIISGWALDSPGTSTTNTSWLLNAVLPNCTVGLITMPYPNAAGTITLNFVARCALERVNVTVTVTTPQHPGAVSTITKISTAVAVSAAAAFGNDASTTASLVLLSLLSCTSLSPDPGVSGYAMSFVYNYGPIAMVSGNIGIGVGVTLLFAATVFVLSRHLGHARYDTAAEILRFPAVPIHVADFFLPGTLFASFLCFWSTEGGALPTGVVGACIVAGYVAGTQIMHGSVVQPLCSFTAYNVPYPTGHAREASILFPRCRWSPHSRNKYSPLVNPFVPGKEWTRTMLLCLSLLLGAVSGMASSGVGCSAGAWIIGVANIVAALALMFLRPFRLPVDKWIAPLTISLIGLSCVLKATGDADLAAASDGLTGAASMLQILRTLLTVWVQAREDQWNEEGKYSIGAKFLFWLFRERRRVPPPPQEEPMTFDAFSSTSVQHPIMLGMDEVKDNRAPTSSYVEERVQMIDFAPVPPAATLQLEHTDVSLFAQEGHKVFEGIDGYFMLEGLKKAPLLL
ncbi:membrane-associated protein, putative [Bodo saltans]|uniref:Membrane-associated protein, putative n=1 Tax=Bodo saltans TaxID=75058 RepID=A0A0S4IXE2_BODSA|nr:membrane-associated protein, putative [Bodo saltans]|eukprot:CUG39245.1 membrane-associated protein, putative [Bodo saltans]